MPEVICLNLPPVEELNDKSPASVAQEHTCSRLYGLLPIHHVVNTAYSYRVLPGGGDDVLPSLAVKAKAALETAYPVTR